MVINYETNRDETRYTFYALNMGDVFVFEEDGGDSIFVFYILQLYIRLNIRYLP